jgi:hypothetical protein
MGFVIVIESGPKTVTSSRNCEPGGSTLGFTKMFSTCKPRCPAPGGLKGTLRNSTKFPAMSVPAKLFTLSVKIHPPVLSTETFIKELKFIRVGDPGVPPVQSKV